MVILRARKRFKSGKIHEYSVLFSWKILLLICQKFGLKPQWPRTPIDRLEDATTTARLLIGSILDLPDCASHLTTRRLILIRIETSEINSRPSQTEKMWLRVGQQFFFSFFFQENNALLTTLRFWNADYSVFPTDKHIFALTIRACM